MGLYYLQSRYYDPALCRFLNADIFVSTGQGELGNNMFAYCRNNPVRRIDISGTADADLVDEDGRPLESEDIEKDAGAGAPGSSTANSNGSGSGNAGGTYNFNGNHNEWYMQSHGWTHDTIREAIGNGRIGSATNKANGNAATVYGHPEFAGHYVVIDNVTRSIVQLSNLKYSVWYADSTIVLD